MTLDGQPYTKNFLRQADLARGARIHLHMDSVPCTTRGTAPDDRPYSLSRG